jgi:hypothetical protein
MAETRAQPCCSHEYLFMSRDIRVLSKPVSSRFYTSSPTVLDYSCHTSDRMPALPWVANAGMWQLCRLTAMYHPVRTKTETVDVVYD